MTGLEPVRRSTHAPQTCLSTSSSTLALISRGEPLVSQRQDILYQGCPHLSTKFAKKFEKFSNAENYYQNRRKSTLFRTLSSAFGGMKNCRPSGNSVGRQKFFYFFAEMLRQAPHALCPNPPSLRMKRALGSGRWDSICCGKQPLNILEVVGLRAPTAVETCHWHVSKSRLSNPTFSAAKKIQTIHLDGLYFGGEGGIRTHVACYRQLDFESSSL